MGESTGGAPKRHWASNQANESISLIAPERHWAGVGRYGEERRRMHRRSDDGQPIRSSEFKSSPIKPSQAKPSQVAIKPSQVKLSQVAIKPSQVKPSQVASGLARAAESRRPLLVFGAFGMERHSLRQVNL